MKKLLFIFVIFGLVACGSGNRQVNVDSSNVITDSSALMNADTTTVIGANGIDKGQNKN